MQPKTNILIIEDEPTISDTLSILRGIKENRDVLEWRVVLMNPEQTYIKFCAFISSLSVAIPMEDLIEFDLTLNPTGAPELGELV